MNSPNVEEIESKTLKEDMRKNFKNFLETFSLYRECSKFVPSDFYNFEFSPLQLRCINCKFETTHEYDVRNSQVNYRPLCINCEFEITDGEYEIKDSQANYAPTDGSTLKFSYKCQHCKNMHYHFQVTFSEGRMFKSGQYPSIEVNVAKDVEDKLGEKLAKLYRQGKACEAHGLGIASMAYYRRVIEGKVMDILLEIETLIYDEGKKKSYAKEIDGIKIDDIINSHSFKRKADAIDVFIPESLKPGGRNLVKLLFDSISKGLHSKDDRECLDIAENTSELLEAIIQILNSQTEAEKTAKEVSERMLKPKNKN